MNPKLSKLSKLSNNYISSLVVFICISSFPIHSQASDSANGAYSLGLGIGPNFSQLDAVSDELNSDIGWSLWGRYDLTRNWNLNLTYDNFNFGGGAKMQDLLLGLGYDFTPNSFWDFYFIVGAGIGNAKDFPRATADQKRLTLQAKPGLDYNGFKNWKPGISLEYVYIDLDDHLAREAYIALPMLTLNYKFGETETENEKKSAPVRSEIPIAALKIDNGSLDDDEDGVVNRYDKCLKSPKGQKVNGFGCPVKEKINLQLLVHFATASDVIQEDDFAKLKEVADLMKKNAKATVVIEGHTDSKGNRKYNIELSRRRASSVVKYLADQFGIDRNRMRSMGFGPDKPISNNSTDEGRKKNRRVMGVFDANE